MQQNQNNPFGFTGYQMDDVSGMYFAQNRYYAAGLGRFGAEDPIKSGLNWYGYCAGNPIGFIDPLGLEPDEYEGKLSFGERFQQWWNTDIYETNKPLFTIPDSNAIISKAANTMAGALFDGIKPWLESITKYYPYSIIDDQVIVHPFKGIEGAKYPKAIRSVGRVSASFATVTLVMDIGNTWTADSGNTNGKRLIKTGVQLAEFGASLVIGKISEEIISASAATRNPAVIVATTGVVITGAAVANYVISEVADKILEHLEIE